MNFDKKGTTHRSIAGVLASIIFLVCSIIAIRDIVGFQGEIISSVYSPQELPSSEKIKIFLQIKDNDNKNVSLDEISSVQLNFFQGPKIIKSINCESMICPSSEELFNNLEE